MRRRALRWLAAFLLLALAALLLISPVRQFSEQLERQKNDAIRDAVLRAAFQCYAMEGVYPPKLQILETHYGLLIDHGKYIISYDCYSSNRPPEVKVLKK